MVDVRRNGTDKLEILTDVRFREDGRSWDVITYDVAQPKGIDPMGEAPIPLP